MLSNRNYYCGNCPNFLDKGDGHSISADIENWKRVGECRKSPPSVDYGKWPPVRFNDWCGEHPSAPMSRTQQLLALIASGEVKA